MTTRKFESFADETKSAAGDDTHSVDKDVTPTAVCAFCSATFSSRNQLFKKHLRDGKVTCSSLAKVKPAFYNTKFLLVFGYICSEESGLRHGSCAVKQIKTFLHSVLGPTVACEWASGTLARNSPHFELEDGVSAISDTLCFR